MSSYNFQLFQKNYDFDRMRLVIRIGLFVILALVSSAGAAPSQPVSGSPAKPNPSPTPIPLAKVPLEAQSALASIQEIDSNVSRDQSNAGGFVRSLSDLTTEIDARVADDTRLLTTNPSLQLLYRLKLTWQSFRDGLSASARDSIERTRQAAESGQAHVLTLQSRISEEEARVRTALSSIEQGENQAVKGLGLQNVINNFVSGLILLFERPIKIGDVIEVGGNVGEVSRIGIRASVIRTADAIGQRCRLTHKCPKQPYGLRLA
jgi:hypothetical protein